MPVIMMSGHGTIDTAVEPPVRRQRLPGKAHHAAKLLRAVEQALVTGARRAPPPAPVGMTGSYLRPGALGQHAAQPTRSPPPPPHPRRALVRTEFDLDRPLREARDAFEKSYFEFHLARENGSMTRVAEKTGLERTTCTASSSSWASIFTRNKRSGEADVQPRAGEVDRYSHGLR